MSRLLLAAAMAVVAASSAQAHITLETGEAPVNSTYKAVLRVGHGCEAAATTRVRVQIPEGVIAVRPMPKAGWELETVTGAYAHPYDYFGEKLAEGVTEISWTGNLPDAYYDEFVFRARLTDGMEVGSEVYFPIVQECGETAARWIEIPAEGQDPDSLEYPAPGLTLLPASTGH